MKRRRECWVDWQRFQDNESDMFKNNDTRQTHGAAFKIQVVGSLSCWRHAKNLFASLVRLKAASFSSWGLMRRWELVSQFLWPQVVQHGARSCGLSGFRFWVRISSPFLGPAILTHAAEVPFLGPQCGPQFRAKSRALNALLGRLFDFFLQSIRQQ